MRLPRMTTQQERSPLRQGLTAVNSLLMAIVLIAITYGNAASADELSGPRALSRAFRDAAKTATPSVVTVVAYGQNKPDSAMPDSLQPEDGDDEQGSGDSEIPNTDEMLPATGLGSGVIISSDGVIITNSHVVKDARRIVVRLHDGLEVRAINTVADPASDIAIVRIKTDMDLVPAKIGDSKKIDIGEWVLAIGSPFRLDATVSAGIISAMGRKLEGVKRGRLLQTDAAINPGNSGGPLINLDGEVIGISTAIATRSGSYEGIGFAVPINQARWIADELREHGEVRRASIGVSLAAINARIAKRMDLPMQKGILIVSVTRDRAASKAGAEAYDAILEFNGEKIVKARELQEAIEREPIGSEQTLKIYRKGEEIELKITLEAAN